MTEHYLKLRGAAVVATDQLLDTRDLVADLLEVKGMGAVYGPAGTGKTFAVDQALGEHPQRLWMRTVFRSRPTTRYVRHELYVQIGLGVVPPASPVETDVLLKRALGERVRLVVIDESQWLNRECFLCRGRHKKHYAGWPFMPRRAGRWRCRNPARPGPAPRLSA